MPPDRIKIETYWNVNCFISCLICRCIVIKIETYWNVNICADNASKKSNGIKIGTYWNVNSVPAAPCLHPADLNRDILER